MKENTKTVKEDIKKGLTFLTILGSIIGVYIKFGDGFITATQNIFGLFSHKDEDKPKESNNYCNINLEVLNNQNGVLNIGNINQECVPAQISIYDMFMKFDQICTKKEKCIFDLIEKDTELKEIQKFSLKGVVETVFSARLPNPETKDSLVCSNSFCVNSNLKITNFNDLSDSEKAKLIVQTRFIEDVKNNTLPTNLVTTVVERLEKEKENNQVVPTSVADTNPYKNQDTGKTVNLIGGWWVDLGVISTKTATNSVQGEIIILLNSSRVELNRVPYKDGLNRAIYINGKVVDITVSGSNVSITKAPQTFNPSNENDPVVSPLPDGKKEGEGSTIEVFDANGNLVP